MTAKIIKCSKCGLSLDASFASSNQIQCPRCETINVVPSPTIISSSPLDKDIVGGLPITATEAAIHKSIVSYIVKDYERMPADIFREMKITEIEYICAPCYVFECNATVRYNYQVGKDRERRQKFGKIEFNEKYVRFINADDSHNFSGRVIISGNSNYDEAFQALYESVNGSKIRSLNSLNYPAGVKQASCDIGISEAKNKTKDIIKNRSIKRIEDRLETNGAPYKDLVIKDNVTLKLDDKPKRILLPLIHVTFFYKTGSGDIWLTGDAEQSYIPFFPTDRSYQKQRAKAKKKNPGGCLGWGLVVLGIMGFVGALASEEVNTEGMFIPILMLAIGAFLILRPSFTKPKVVRKTDDRQKIFSQFLFNKVPLKGVFHDNLEGNPEAFPEAWFHSNPGLRKR